MLNTVTTAYMLQLVKNIPLFQGLQQEFHQQVINNIHLEYFGKGHMIFEQNSPADKMYIIKKGKVKIFFPDNPDKNSIILGDNNFFGEMALISDLARNASVVAEEDSEIFSISSSDFAHLLANEPQAAALISKTVIERTKHNERID